MAESEGELVLQDASWTSASLLGDEEDIQPRGELSRYPILEEGEPAGLLHSPGGAREFFWATLAPFTLCACFGMAVLVSFFAAWLLPTDASELFRLSGLVLLLGAVLLIPIQYCLIRACVEKPLLRLEHELRGQLPWRPDGDVLLAPLRRAVQQVRDAFVATRSELQQQVSRAEDLAARLEAQRRAQGFAARVAETLVAAETMDEFAVQAARLVREVWPAEHVLLVGESGRDNGELSLLYYERHGLAQPLTGTESRPRYRCSSLPVPMKEALRTGFYAESGLPFSHDLAFPEARSFLALALHYHGVPQAVLMAACSLVDPGSPESLRYCRPLLSLGYSRAHYLRDLEEAAIRDALTGAFTYDHFLAVLRHELSRSNRYSRPVCCLMLDIDGLRRVNDSYGADSGDQVICQATRVVEGLIRSSDTLARMSGGELVLVLPETNLEAAQAVAERIRVTVEEYPFLIQRNHVERITVSLGIGCHPPHGVTALALLDAAREALIAAKKAGSNRVAAA